MYSQITKDQVKLSDTSSMIQSLGGGVWLVEFDPNIGYFLTRQADMELPAKIYGANHEICDRIMHTFELRQGKTTGVMLQGAKGTGKTLTAIEVCIEANKKGMPVLLIQSEFWGSDFNDFMGKIPEPCVVFIDEFEKVYTDRRAIASTLMLLDGAIKTTKLFLLTSNSILREEEHFKFLDNRPSRVHYTFEYGSLSKEAIEEYIEDELVHKVYKNDILAIRRAFTLFTIDILKAIVFELNTYGDAEGKNKLVEVIKNVNAKTDRTISSYIFDKYLVINGKRLKCEDHVHEDHTTAISSFKLDSLLNNYDYLSVPMEIPFSVVSQCEVEEVVRHCETVTVQPIGASVSKSRLGKDLAKVIIENDSEAISETLDHALQGVSHAERIKILRADRARNIFASLLTLRVTTDDIDCGLIRVTQNEKTRAICLHFSDNLHLEFIPQIKDEVVIPKFYI